MHIIIVYVGQVHSQIFIKICFKLSTHDFIIYREKWKWHFVIVRKILYQSNSSRITPLYLCLKSLSIGINLVHHQISLETDAVYTVRIIFNITYGICMMNKTRKFTVWLNQPSIWHFGFCRFIGAFLFINIISIKGK